MGAQPSTCCALNGNAEEHRLEEWRMCANFDECVMNTGRREEWKMCSSFDECIEPGIQREAWAPMPVAAMKALDTDRIDPWTREVVDQNDYGGILGTMIGVSPTQAPSGYLAQSAGREVIMSDGKDGHMLLSTDMNFTPRDENQLLEREDSSIFPDVGQKDFSKSSQGAHLRTRPASQSAKVRVATPRMRAWSASSRLRSTVSPASPRRGPAAAGGSAEGTSPRRGPAAAGGSAEVAGPRKGPAERWSTQTINPTRSPSSAYDGRPASAPYSPGVPRGAFAARVQELDGAEGSLVTPREQTSPQEEGDQEGLLEGDCVAGPRWNDRPIPASVARAAAEQVAVEEEVPKTPTLRWPMRASRRVEEANHVDGEEDGPLRAPFQAPGTPLLEKEDTRNSGGTIGTAVSQRFSDGL